MIRQGFLDQLARDTKKHYYLMSDFDRMNEKYNPKELVSMLAETFRPTHTAWFKENGKIYSVSKNELIDLANGYFLYRMDNYSKMMSLFGLDDSCRTDTFNLEDDYFYIVLADNPYVDSVNRGNDYE